MNKAYLGDGVYVEIDECGCVVLTTENGIEMTNRIVLEFDVYAALTRYIEHQGLAEEKGNDDDSHPT